ncbi:MAG TPA: hypothetical protein VGT41_00835 [Candidatus Babeliales bacterium]|nr:hypothetical protein [Candidatus Babeliales bacterium]
MSRLLSFSLVLMISTFSSSIECISARQLLRRKKPKVIVVQQTPEKQDKPEEKRTDKKQSDKTINSKATTVNVILVIGATTLLHAGFWHLAPQYIILAGINKDTAKAARNVMFKIGAPITALGAGITYLQRKDTDTGNEKKQRRLS